ncbi:MAG TPA: nucleotidyltransferase family protein [bacterium]|nr:nucleotidyltransferase family protein [bacterium]
MRAIVLAAGRGRRLEPLTLTTPKPLLAVAGRPILAHILDALAAVGILDVVVVVGHLGDQIAAYLETRPGPRARVAVQSPLGGNGDAVRAARVYLEGPVLVAFGDTILAGDLSPAVGGGVPAIAVARVEDGRSYGIVETDAGGWVRRLWEKPAVPPSHDAFAGMFVFPEGQRLREALDEIAALGADARADMTSPAGEVWLTDVVQRMIDRGERVRTFRVDAFYDCGTPDRLAEAERALRGAGGAGRRGADPSVPPRP